MVTLHMDLKVVLVRMRSMVTGVHMSSSMALAHIAGSVLAHIAGSRLAATAPRQMFARGDSSPPTQRNRLQKRWRRRYAWVILGRSQTAFKRNCPKRNVEAVSRNSTVYAELKNGPKSLCSMLCRTVNPLCLGLAVSGCAVE